MSEKSPKDLNDEPGAEERFERGLKNALATPRRSHVKAKSPPQHREKPNTAT